MIVHPSGIVGPYDRYKSNHLVQLMSLYLNRRLLLGVRGGYDFVDVRDVAEGVLLAAEKGRQGECYILSDRYIRLEEAHGSNAHIDRKEVQASVYFVLCGKAADTYMRDVFKNSPASALSTPPIPWAVLLQATQVSATIRQMPSLGTPQEA